MRQLTIDDLARLRSSHESPCISLYQPTHRHHPDNQQDPIRYRNLQSQLTDSLRQKYPKRHVQLLLAKYQVLERDGDFWNHRTDGLAILSSPHTFQLFELQRPVQELLVVAQTFYTKPLLRILQSADRFQILCLSRQEMKLYEGNRDALDEVDLSDVPSTLTAALGEELTAPRVAVRAAPGGTTIYYGSGQKSEEMKIDRERFFRAVDRAILEHYSRPSGLPLILAALPEYHVPFRTVSHNPFLLAEGIQTNPDALDLDQLRVRAWEQMLPVYLQRLAKLIEQYQAARGRQLSSDDLMEVAAATAAGRVATLLVEADRQVPGTFDEATGRLERGAPPHPEIGDVLNDLADAVVRMKGEVVVVPAERMPSATGVAATYRY